MPVITISRMYGSGGSDIAARVAQSLGWQLFDNAFIDAVARQSGLSPAEVAEREERIPPLAQRIATALSLATPEVMAAIPDTPIPSADEQILAIERRVIEEAVQSGPAVFVGRGAQCLLAERADALHVFCHAPRAWLCQHVAKRLSVSLAEAERLVVDTNRQREQFVRRNFKRDWRAPENYHLCINTAWLGIDDSADVVVEIARKQFG